MKPGAGAYAEALREFDHRWWLALFAECQGNITLMAKRSGVHRSNVYRTLKRKGVDFAARQAHAGKWGD